jgi:hypothetical protein
MMVGRWVLVEGVGETLDACIMEALTQRADMQRSVGASSAMSPPASSPVRDSPVRGDAGTLGGVHAEFQLFVTTRHANPHYSPEVGACCVAVVLACRRCGALTLRSRRCRCAPRSRS